MNKNKIIPTEINYRRLNANESKTYRLIRLESLKNHPNSFGSTYEQQQQKTKLAFENFIEDPISENFIIGAFYRKELIGICGFYRHSDNRCCHRGEIIQMYIQSNYQSNGIGFNLLKVAIKEAFKINGLEQIELGVIANLKSAYTVYIKAGFKEYGIQKNLFKIKGHYFDQSLMILNREDNPSLNT